MSDNSIKSNNIKLIQLDVLNDEIHKFRLISAEEIDLKNIIFGFDFYSFFAQDLIEIISETLSNSISSNEISFNRGIFSKDYQFVNDDFSLYGFSHQNNYGFLAFSTEWSSVFSSSQNLLDKNLKDLNNDPAVRSFLEYISLRIVKSINQKFILPIHDRILLSSDQYFSFDDIEVKQELKAYLKFDFKIKDKVFSIFYFLPKTLLQIKTDNFPHFINHNIVSDSFGLVNLEVIYCVIPVSLEQLVSIKKAGTLINISEYIDLSQAYLNVGGVRRGKLEIVLEDGAFVFELNEQDVIKDNTDKKTLSLDLRIFSKEVSYSEHQKNSTVIRSDKDNFSSLELILGGEVIGRAELVKEEEQIFLKIL